MLRAQGAKPAPIVSGKVLFINADREFHEGRAQNYLLPEARREDCQRLRRLRGHPRLRHAWSRATSWRRTTYNLNIRRYADNAPIDEPQDVRAHLRGGIPTREVDAKHSLFVAHGFEPSNLLTNGSDGYVAFAEAINTRDDIRNYVVGNAGLLDKEGALQLSVDTWWAERSGGIAGLRTSQRLMQLRADLLSSFEDAARPFGLLDRFEVAGVIASWWGENQIDLKTIAARSCLGLVCAWESSILSALEDRDSDDKNVRKLATKEDPFNHKLIRQILPEYLEEISELQVRKGDLEAQLKPAADADDAGPLDEVDGTELSADEVKAIRKQLTSERKALKALQKEFVERLQDAVAGLTEATARDLVLAILQTELRTIIDRCVSRHRDLVVGAFQNWWDKYRVALPEVTHQRDEAAQKLASFLVALGYEH